MTKLFSYWVPVLSTFGLLSCGKPLPSKSQAIIGESQLRPLEGHPHQHRFQSIVPAIGLSNYNCTTFHLGKGLVATAGHCFPTKTAQHQPCLETTITWGKHATEAHPLKSRCVEILQHIHNDQQDFVLLQVDPIPQRHITLQPSPDPLDDHWVVGHPQGKPLHLSSSCHLEVDSEFQVEHQCDTLPGNSGSPVINKDLEVVAIHNGGDELSNYATLLKGIDTQAAFQQLERDMKFPRALSFGPMTHNQAEVLLKVTTAMAKDISFDIELDTEDGYDQLKYVDSNGMIKSLSGQQSVSLRKLPTPVIVVFYSDYAGISQSIKFRNFSASSP